MFYRLSITFVAVAFLTTAAALKATALVRDGGRWPLTDALLVTGEGVLAVACGMFLFGRATGWLLSVAYLGLANVALYYALAEKPCGCLGATVVSPWLMAGVDFALALSLLVVAGWTPWATVRPKWATAAVGITTLAVVAAALAGFASSRRGVSDTPPPIVDTILDAMRRNYEGLDNEQYTWTDHLVQPAMPVPQGGNSLMTPILPDSTLTATIHRRDGLVCESLPNGERSVTNGALQIQYLPQDKVAWVRNGNGLSEKSLDPRRLGLPKDWDPTLGSVGAGTQWKQVVPASHGPSFVELSFHVDDPMQTVNVVFDPAQNFLPVLSTRKILDGSVVREFRFHYVLLDNGQKFRLATCQQIVPLARPDVPDAKAIITYTVDNYRRGEVASSESVDFRIPEGVRITDTVAGVQRKGPKRVTELFATATPKAARTIVNTASPSSMMGYLAIAGLDMLYFVALVLRSRTVRV